MLLDLLFGSYRQRVLAQLLLHPESSYHVRELARLTGTSAGTLHKELARLAEVGLLLREKQGNQVRYQANRECPVFSELAGLFRKTSGLVDVLAEALASLQPAPALVLVFGSLARGDENARSDVDLLLIADCRFGDAIKALHPAQAILQREINPVLYTASEFAERLAARESFVQNILIGPKLFVIGSADDLGKLAGDSSPAGI